MMRICWVLITLLLLSTEVFADELILDKESGYQKDVMQTGVKILNANNIEKRVVFYYVPENKVKVTHSHDAVIRLYKGMLPFIEDENELAAAISKELALLIDKKHNLFRLCTMGFSPLKYDKKSDKKAVDYMVNAGYNPIGMITYINNTTPETGLIDYTHYKGSERVAYVYKHIYEKYPQYLAHNEYLKNDAYQHFLHTSKTERAQIRKIQKERVKMKKSKTNKEKV